MSSGEERFAVAVIGMEARFPGARSVEEYWENLCAGRESITRFRDEDLDHSIAPEVRSDPAYVPARGILEDAMAFDAAFFGITPREAELMDPQQRVFLELSWSALERAGYDPKRVQGSVGVYAGMANNTYYLSSVLAHPEKVRRFGEFQTMLANEKDFLATRVSHKLDLRGPSISLYTGCSTSLVAVAQAFHALLSFQCDMALAGGVCITVPQNSGYLHRPEGIESADGHCRPFDAAATGTVFSNGAGLVVLKRLEDAVRDSDHIHAVLIGAALNNDGAGKVGFAAPSVAGQAEVIADALAQGEVEPSSIGYVEAHGTATKLGDPVEVEGLRQAYHHPSGGQAYCALGSVKGNFGHLLAAAGVAGLIKAVLAVEHDLVPPTINFDTPNPGIDLANSPFFINRETAPFPDRGGPRRAGVSSFGIGGTNAHVVIEQAPASEPSDRSGRPELLVLSARNEATLSKHVTRTADHLATHPGLDMGDVSYTLQAGRRAFPHRFFSVVTDAANAAEALRTPDPRTSGTIHGNGEAPEVLFLFPGAGAWVEGPGEAYYAHDATYRTTVDECRASRAGEAGGGESDLLRGFVTGYALARTWIAWGIRPRAVLGHGLGELVAACVSGVLQPRDAMRYLRRLAELSPATPKGQLPVFDELGDGLWEVCAGMSFGRPRIPWFSSVSGRLIDLNTASDPSYWSRLPQAADCLDEAAAAALAGGINLVFESGPGSQLGPRVLQQAGQAGARLVQALPGEAKGPTAEWVHALSGLGQCWLAGCDIDWDALHPGARRRVGLPTYPFERVSHCLPTRPAVERPSPVAEV